jgi:hypothetical protein
MLLVRDLPVKHERVNDGVAGQSDRRSCVEMSTRRDRRLDSQNIVRFARLLESIQSV